MKIINWCPVCGFNNEEPAERYNICPCCGTEFGVSDRFATHQELRTAWLEAGAKWWSRYDPPPNPWNPLNQLLDAGMVPFQIEYC